MKNSGEHVTTLVTGTSEFTNLSRNLTEAKIGTIVPFSIVKMKPGELKIIHVACLYNCLIINITDKVCIYLLQYSLYR